MHALINGLDRHDNCVDVHRDGAHSKKPNLMMATQGSASISILALLGWGTILLADDVHHTAPKGPLPTDGSSGVPNEQFSIISVPIRIPLGELSNRLNNMVPPSINGKQDFPVPLMDRGSNVDYEIHRGAFGLAPNPGGEIGFSVSVDGHGHLNYKFHHLLIHSVNHTPWHAAGVISGRVRPEIQPDWQIQPNLQANIDVQNANFMIKNLHVAGFLRDRLNERIPQLTNSATPALNQALALHDRLTAYWTQAFRLFQVSNEPNIYIKFVPKSIQLVQPHSTTDGLLLSGAGIDCSCSLFVGGRPQDPTPTPLPTATIVAAVEPKFQLLVPVSISLQEVAKVLENKLRDQKLTFASDATATVRNIVVGSTGNKLLIRASIDAVESTLGSQLEGEVTLEGVPVISPDGVTLELDQLGYTIESKNELINLAAWLLKPLVLTQLKSVLVVNLDSQIAAANKAANTELIEKFKSSNFQPSVTFNSLQASNILIFGDKVVITFGASGTCELNITL
ncbi:MAG: hypothetical protein C5B58_15200 [Acidobacteria bacterium]|nr:MAG: hypothetical protein C5B58_15200 [Acidobacteriota bacterium]